MVGSSSYVNFEQLLSSQGEYVTTVHGISMYPMLRYMKDPIRIVPVSGDLKRYDIAVYDRGSKYVVHRVLKVCDDHYVIRGDNCNAREYVPKEDVVGSVAGFWRLGRYISVNSPVHKIYARVWVAINPLVRLAHKFDPRKLRRKLTHSVK